MIGALLGHHAPPITAAAPSSGAAAPVPACYPRPPLAPIAFSMSGLATLDLTISAAISPAKSIATITTAQLAANVSLVVRGSVPGCSFAITGSPVVSGIQMTGTPTTAGDFEVELICINASCEALGGLVLSVTVLDPSALLDVGSCANYSGRAGIPVDALLCSPEIDINWSATAHPNKNILGCEFVFAWTPGSPTSSGTLRLQGTPVLALVGSDGNYVEVNTTVTVTYRHGTRVLGTSEHNIQITRLTAPPAPAPAPGPPAPAPTPAPTAAPRALPGPLPEADPHIANVLALFNFESVSVTRNGDDYAYAKHVAPIGGGLLAMYGGIDAGIAGSGAIVDLGIAWDGAVTWGDADRPALAVDGACIVDARAELWSKPHGTFMAIASLAVDDTDIAWAVGLLRVDVAAGGGAVHAKVFPAFIQGRAAGYDSPVVALAPELPQTYTGAVLVSGQWSLSGSTVTQACWWNGQKGTNVTATKARAGVAAIIFRVGGFCPLVGYPSAPMIGLVDEVRVTAALRRSTSGDLSDAEIALPWPTY